VNIITSWVLRVKCLQKKFKKKKKLKKEDNYYTISGRTVFDLLLSLIEQRLKDVHYAYATFVQHFVK